MLQNAFPSGPLFSTHILSLETVLTVVEMVERNCAAKQQQKRSEMNEAKEENVEKIIISKIFNSK